MTANNATIAAAVTQRRRCVQFHDPVGHLGLAGFFSPISTATLKFGVFPIFSAERFAILGTESLALRISAVLAGAERMVPIATRKRFMGGKDVQPTR
jgi:hypothetical protein